MAWWQWAMATLEALLLAILVLLWFDSMRERRGWRLAQHRRLLIVPAGAIPVGFLAVLLSPLWLGLILIGVPTLAITVMAMAS